MSQELSNSRDRPNAYGAHDPGQEEVDAMVRDRGSERDAIEAVEAFDAAEEDSERGSEVEAERELFVQQEREEGMEREEGTQMEVGPEREHDAEREHVLADVHQDEPEFETEGIAPLRCGECTKSGARCVLEVLRRPTTRSRKCQRCFDLHLSCSLDTSPNSLRTRQEREERVYREGFLDGYQAGFDEHLGALLEMLQDRDEAIARLRTELEGMWHGMRHA